MNKRKVSYVASAAAMMFGAGALSTLNVFATGSGATDFCSLQLEAADEAATKTVGTLAELAAALGNADISKIVLSGNITLDEVKTIDRDLIIDLNGFNLTSAEDKRALSVTGTGRLSIEDKSGNGSVTSTMSNGGSAIVVDGDNAALILNGGNIINNESYGIYAKNGAEVIINNGKVVAAYAALSGNNLYGDMNFCVNGGVLDSKMPSIYMPGQTNLIVNGGTLKGIVARMGQIKINGGTLSSAEVVEDMKAEYKGQFIAAPDTIAVIGGVYTSDNETYGNELNLEIGGNAVIESSHGNAVAIYNFGAVEQEMNVSIKGGKLSTADDGSKAYKVITLDDLGIDDAGYSKVENTVDMAISGGVFSTEPVIADIVSGYTSYETTDGNYAVLASDIEKPTVSDDVNTEGSAEQDTNEEAMDAIADDVVDGLIGNFEKIEDGATIETEGGVKVNIVSSTELKEALQNGTQLSIGLVKTGVSEDVEYADPAIAAAIEAINAALKDGMTKLGIVDFSLVLTTAGNIGQLAYISEIPGGLELTYDVSNVSPVAAGYTRAWKAYRYHNGEVDEIDATYDENTKSIKFASDKYSLYGVAYVDTLSAVPDTGMFTGNTNGASAKSAAGMVLTIATFVAAALLGLAAKKSKR